MALVPKPRGMIWVSASDYATIKSGSHQPSFSVQPDTTKPDMAAWFFAYARCFRSNYMYYLSASQLTAKDPSDTGVKAVLETEEAGQYAYMCFEDLDMTKFTDGQFNLVKQLVANYYKVTYNTYTGVFSAGGPDSGTDIEATVLSTTVVLPPLRSAFDYATFMSTTLSTTILKFNMSEWINMAPITVVVVVKPADMPKQTVNRPTDPVPTDEQSAEAYETAWQTYYDNCTKQLAKAVDDAINQSIPLPTVPTTHNSGVPSTGVCTVPTVDFTLGNNPITVNLLSP